MPEYCMPSLGADMESGTVLEWHVQPGDAVHRGQTVMLVDTEKAEIEAEIWEDGVVEEILVPVGRKVAVGTPLLRLASAAARADMPARPARAETAAPAPAAPSAPAAAAAAPPIPPAAARPPASELPPRPVAPPPSPTAPAAPRVAASPRARRLAREQGIDLAGVRGSGPAGAIRADDIGSGTAAGAPGPPPAEGLGPERLASLRGAIAAAMARSKREIPHYYLASDVDVSRSVAWLAEANARRPVAERLLLGALFLKATAHGLVRVPELNGHYRDGRFVPGPGIHLGVAIALRGGGLLAPALLDVDQKPVDTLMAELRDLVARARRARLRGVESTAATCTVTSLGDLGVDAVFGVIQPPQVALVGFGAVRERPWAENGLLGVRPVVRLTLSADHRVSDGLRGARLLTAIAAALAQPEQL